MSTSLSLEKGLHILNMLKEANGAMGVREMARRLDVSPSVAQRLLNTLAEQGFVEQDITTRRYQLGYAVLGLAQHVSQRGRLLDLAKKELQTLAEGGCFNGFLGVQRGSVGIYVLGVQSNSPVVIRAQPGETMPLHATALGKALMFDADDRGISKLFENRVDRYTDRTITEPDKLIQQIHSARGQGYATAISEHVEGVISVGAPVRDETGSIVAAMSLAFPRAVYPKVKITDVAQDILEAANRVSSGLGFEQSSERE
ncbi:IclR family transcriptional regulator [Agrobacterium tumefaciens]|uniref:IclR family transcriptional regulator n=1 Tax=Agrobacterium tumefaciens TaxID=358 RepID=UPI0015745212|nr:IclR family transcriptional regulator [Agrobacterium tumefaciens]